MVEMRLNVSSITWHIQDYYLPVWILAKASNLYYKNCIEMGVVLLSLIYLSVPYIDSTSYSHLSYVLYMDETSFPHLSKSPTFHTLDILSPHKFNISWFICLT